MVRRLGRVVATLLIGIVLVGGPMATQALDDGCVERTVRNERDCVSEDTITVISEGDTDRADLEAAIEPFKGGIFLDAGGVYTVVFPGARFRDLAPDHGVIGAARVHRPIRRIPVEQPVPF